MSLFHDFFSLKTLFVVMFTIQTVAWLGAEKGYMNARIQSRKRRERRPSLNSKPVRFSVIVAVKNEEQHISSLLKCLTGQTLAPVEIIIVDDHSTDQTAAITRKWQNGNTFIKLISSQGNGKKAALETGIKTAGSDVCAFTDADCLPPETWLERHALYHQEGSESVVVGFSPLTTQASFLGLAQRFDVEISQLMAASAIGNKVAYAATGRNLSYSTSLFEKVGGFERHKHTLSGDDDLLIQDIRSQTDAAFYWDDSAEIAVESAAPSTWKDWLVQKRRHASDGRQFIRDVKISQSIFYLALIGPWAIIATDFTMLFFMAPLIIAFQWYAMWDAHKMMGKRWSFWWLPVLSPWFALYSLIVPITGHLNPPRTW